MKMVYDADLGDYICTAAPMPWVVVAATPRDDYTIELEFADGKTGVYDARPLLEWRIFEKLNELPFFMLAKAAHGTVAWPGGIDIAPENLYEICRAPAKA